MALFYKMSCRKEKSDPTGLTLRGLVFMGYIIATWLGGPRPGAWLSSVLNAVPGSRQLPALPAGGGTDSGWDAKSRGPKLASGRSVQREGEAPRYEPLNHQRGRALGWRDVLPALEPQHLAPCRRPRHQPTASWEERVQNLLIFHRSAGIQTRL